MASAAASDPLGIPIPRFPAITPRGTRARPARCGRTLPFVPLLTGRSVRATVVSRDRELNRPDLGGGSMRPLKRVRRQSGNPVVGQDGGQRGRSHVRSPPAQPIDARTSIETRLRTSGGRR
jgi:hypothetical protein